MSCNHIPNYHSLFICIWYWIGHTSISDISNCSLSNIVIIILSLLLCRRLVWYCLAHIFGLAFLSFFIVNLLICSLKFHQILCIFCIPVLDYLTSLQIFQCCSFRKQWDMMVLHWVYVFIISIIVNFLISIFQSFLHLNCFVLYAKKPTKRYWII